MYTSTDSDFRNNYIGPQLSLWITGGGFSFLEMLKKPGCSRFLNNVIIPYSENQINRLLEKNWLHDPESEHIKSCSLEAVDLYCRCLELESGSGGRYCAVSASLTTNRYRKGLNQVFIAIKETDTDCDIWQINLAKPSEEVFKNENFKTFDLLRFFEDTFVSKCMEYLLIDKNTISPINKMLEERSVFVKETYMDNGQIEEFKKVR